MSNSFKQSAKGPHSRRHSNPHLDKMLAGYATTATAVGVALLATAQPAEAKIIYTKANVTASSYLLDLNRDGVPDFNIRFCSCGGSGTNLWVEVSSSQYIHAGQNAIRVQAASPRAAAALVRGALIGPTRPFYNPRKYYGATMAWFEPYSSGGPWINVTNRYLGLKFLIHGEVHYGWARITNVGLWSFTVTGYAYETTVGKSLRAGQTSETAVDEADGAASLTMPTTKGPSLGMLACGAEAMAVWRRKEQIA
jgi:hypothetical protein